MPYRRLPNTDAARIKALKVALEKGREFPPYLLAFSAKNIVKIQGFLPLFEHNIQLQRQSLSSQNKRSKNYYEIQHKAKMYLTHFIRVMNMAIMRGELPATIREYYGFNVDDSNVPLFNSEEELIQKGRSIIEGEEKRILNGGSPITNPTIAVVKVWFEKFLDVNTSHKTTARRTMDYSEKVVKMRKEADSIILSTWNEIEEKFKMLPEEEKKRECESYGVVYFYRKVEKERMSVSESLHVNHWN